ncbi:hypothetical protein ABVT39_026226 [Epinephelus coioides]
MPSHLIVCIITVLWIKGVCLSNEKVFQTPADLIWKPDFGVNLSLTHDISRYDTILWYQRSAGDTALKLVAYIYYKTPKVEPAFVNKFSVSGDGEKTAYLRITKLKHPEDSREYFGAASIDMSHHREHYVHMRKFKMFVILFLSLSLLTDIVLSLPTIKQSPPLIKPEQEEARLDCYHGDNDYPYMLWYQHKSAAGRQRDMELIGLLYYERPTLEKNFETRQVNAVVFQQSPLQIVKQGTEVQINCRHDDTSLVIMLWYQQREDSMSMTLIGYGYANSDQNYEGQFEKEFELTREDTVTGALVVRKAKVSDSAVYFCAASTQ